jgi:hypothetical protein
MISHILFFVRLPVGVSLKRYPTVPDAMAVSPREITYYLKNKNKKSTIKNQKTLVNLKWE